MNRRTKRAGAAAAAALCMALTAAAALAAAEFKLPAPERITLGNGLVVYYHRNTDQPLVSFRLWLRGAGTAHEPAGLEGAANLAADLLLKGTDDLDAEALAEALDFMGANLSIAAAEEYASAGGDSLAEHFPRLLEIAAGCLIRPTFPGEEFTKERARRIDAVKALKDNPGSALQPYFLKAYFKDHPMGRLSLGTEASLQAMTLDDLRGFYRTRFRPDRAVASVVGDIGKDDLTALLEKTLGAWANPGGAAPDAGIPPLPRVEGRTLLLVDKPDATQAYFALGAPGYPVGAEISPDAAVMNTLWGGRFTSWLNTELRIKRGLTYGASSSFRTWAPGGQFVASSYTKNDSIGQMLDIVFDLLSKAAEQGFAGEEVESARNYILGQFPPTLETNGSKAGAYVRLAFYDLGFDYYGRYLAGVSAVTPAEARQAAGALLPRQSFVLVVVGKAGEIREQLSKYGTWTEKKISEPGF